MVEYRVKLCVTLPKEMADEFEKQKKETGIPISKQIEFKLRGYKISKIKK